MLTGTWVFVATSTWMLVAYTLAHLMGKRESKRLRSERLQAISDLAIAKSERDVAIARADRLQAQLEHRLQAQLESRLLAQTTIAVNNAMVNYEQLAKLFGVNKKEERTIEELRHEAEEAVAGLGSEAVEEEAPTPEAL